jgi:hypothetical protein
MAASRTVLVTVMVLDVDIGRLVRQHQRLKLKDYLSFTERRWGRKKPGSQEMRAL